MPTPRVLLGMALGALVAALGALFLGEYEFDELLPILSGALLGLIVAEVVVSVGRLRALPLAVTVATWSATAVVLAGYLDSNETEPIKNGAYVSAGLAALAALARANDWRRGRRAATPEDEPAAEPSPSLTGTDVSSDAADRTARIHERRRRPEIENVVTDEPEWVDDWAEEAPTRRQSRGDENEGDWPELPSAPARTRARTARHIEPRPDDIDPPRRTEPSRRPRRREGGSDTERVRVTARPRRRTDRGR